MSDYTVDYFIQKFEAIPEEKWRVHCLHLNGKCCAYGHCGMRNSMKEFTPEADALRRLMYGTHGLPPTIVNDGGHSRYRQSTPKQRILAALQDIKAKSQSQEGGEV